MTIDAVSRSEIDWHAINWQEVYQTVRRLQMRIVKAAQDVAKPGLARGLGKA